MKKLYIMVSLMMAMGSAMIAQNFQGIVQDYLQASIGESDLKTSDISEWTITDVVPSLNPAIQHVYVQQKHQGIPVENGRFKLTVKNGQISWSIDQFVADISQKSSGLAQSLSAENAIMKVAQAHNLPNPQNLSKTTKSSGLFVYENTGISLEPVQAQKVYYSDMGTLKLAWKVNIYQLDAKHWWNVLVDAGSGSIIKTEDWVVTCNFGTPDHENHNHNAFAKAEETFGPLPKAETTAMVGGGSYNVYPLGIESPSHGNRTIVTDPAVANASPYGWHDTNGAAGAEFTYTRGNNVLAQEDTNGNNGSGARPDGGSSLDFNFPLNLNNSPSTFLDAATTNLFYWNNIMHDVWYQYGFNEASGNFQENNYGKGGAGSDSVNADAQDGSGTNNANFATPPDGSNPRMQMFLFTNPTRDGDFDNVIIAHEYGHGISTRLVGGPSTNALGGSEQMGEGWSDWFGLVMTIRPGDTRDTARGVGTYAIGQPTTGAGIRPTRYSTDLAVNGTTYSDIGGLAVPHGVGYGFATILWDMTWDLIDLEGYDADQYSGTGGNNIAMALVIEGLKNTANNPGYVSGRDGILQADQDLYGGQYNCLIWDAFARRGVGVDAVENNNGGTNTNSDQTVSFTSGCGGGGGTPDACSGTVASFPDAESFETNLGNWSQSPGDDLDWTRDTAGTPSNNTGPTSGAAGATYIYVEASGNGTGFPNKRAILNSPCYDLSGESGATFNFSYHMFGAADMGRIDLEVSTDDGATWTSIWFRTGNQGNQWNAESIDLNTYAGEANFRMRFNRVTGGTWQADIALDAFEMEGGNTADTQAPSTPTNLSVTNVSTTTVDLAWNASTDNVGVTGYDVFQGANNIGTTTGTTANVTGLAEGTTYTFTVRARDAAGNVSGASNAVNATTDTTPPPGGCTGGVSSLPYGESYEANLGLWTQASGDDLNWTRDSAGTPSNNTGPSSGSAGSFYVYVEASGNGTGYPNKRAILNSPCFDLSGETEATFTFDYHMFGSSDFGTIALEASTDSGATWTNIWNQTGNQGNQWNAVSIDMTAYAGGSVQLRFNRVTGGTWQADLAVDNVALTAGGGGGNPNLPTGYCAASGNNNSEEYIQRFQMGSIDNNSGRGATGYSDFTNISTNLSSTNNSFVITPTWPGTVYNEAYGIWVDFNRDGDFADAGEQVFAQAPTQATSISGSFNVPSGATAGPTVMRVVMRYNVAPGACGSFNFGEVEDYRVEIPASSNFAGGSDENFMENILTNENTVDFSIYPNPVTRGLLSISTREEATSYTIYNMTGQIVRSGAFKPTLDVSRLQAGVYVLEVSTGDRSKIERFVKQ